MSFFALASLGGLAQAQTAVAPPVPAAVAEQVATKTLTATGTHSDDLVWLSKTIYTFKGFDNKSGQPVSWTWDETGAILADKGAALRKQEAAARRQCDGAMTDSLWQAVADLKTGESYPVLIWLPAPEVNLDKTLVLADPKLNAWLVEQRNAGYAAARDKLLVNAPWLASRVQVVADAPAVVAQLSRAEMADLAHVDGIAELLPFHPGKPSSSTSYVDAIEAAYGTTLKDGSGQGVCLIEADKPTAAYSSPYTPWCQNGTTSLHGRCSAAMIRSYSAPEGSARAATLHFGNWQGANCTGKTQEGALNWCSGTGDTVWNVGFESTAGYDALLDHYAKTYPYPLVTVPTGQQMAFLDCPDTCSNTPQNSKANGLSVLIVGGSRDCETPNRADDMVDCSTFSANPLTRREVPHLVAPSYLLMADNTTCGTGTSWSAALTAGGATQLIQTNNTLAGWPEALRAILMATATVGVDGVTLDLNDTVDDKDGAGEIDIGVANRAGGSTFHRNGGDPANVMGHDYGYLTSSGTPASTYYSEVYNLEVSLTQPTRVVLTWDGSGTCTNYSDVSTCSSDTLDADLDLYVYDANGSLVASSTSGPNSFEFVQFQATTSGTYTAKVYAYGWTASNTYFGLAWRTGAFTNN